MMNAKIATIVAGAFIAVVAAQSIGIFGVDAPSIYSPGSLLLVLPFFFGLPAPIVIAMFVASFFAWRPALFQGSPIIPRRTMWLLPVAGISSLLIYALGWQYGLQFQGPAFTVSCLILSLLETSACALFLLRTRSSPTFIGSLVTHTLLFAWLASYAFPYLGEVP